MNNTLFRDLLMNMLLGLTAVCLALMMVRANPSVDSGKQPGNMIVSIAWPDGGFEDIDLWVSAPGEPVAVGYSNRAGQVFNLLRDDLGAAGDTMPLNYENAYSRGLPAGQYTVNLHYYRGTKPIDVDVEIRYGAVGAVTKLYFRETVTLNAQGQERTVISFTLDENGQVTATNRVFKALRHVVGKG